MNVSLVRENFKLKIRIENNGESEMFDALSFKSFRPTQRNISEFYSAGVRLFSILSSGMKSALTVPYSLYGESWLDDFTYDFDVIDRQIELFKSAAPDGYFALMIQLDTRSWWLKKYPGYPDTFRCLSQAAGDNKWREAASKYLQAVLRHVEKKYGDCFYGYFMLCGTTTEWFSDWDFEQPHPLKEKAYRERNPNAQIPEKAQRELPPERVFAHPVTEKQLVEYRVFHNELIADTVLYFAARAQEVLEHKKLLGVYFGYVFELGVPRLWNAGHIAYEKVFESTDIDMISSPSSYNFRGTGSTSGFMVPHATLNNHNKLYYLEFDHITHLAPSHIEGIPIPGGVNKYGNEQQTIDVMRRDFLLTLSKGASLWWFDMFEGWFYSRGMMDEVQKMIELSSYVEEFPTENISEIAVIVDPNSLYYMHKNSRLSVDILILQHLGLATTGAPYDLLSSCDVSYDNLKHYKMLVFMNMFHINESAAREINRLKSDNRMLLWFYAPGYVQQDGFSIDAVSKMTGITVRQTEVSEEIVVLDGIEYGNKDNKDLTLAVCDDDATVLGTFKHSGEPALAYKEISGYISGYSSVGNIPGAALRMFARLAGVHLYSETDDCVLYINSRIIGVYHRHGRDAKIKLCQDVPYRDLFSGKVYKPENKALDVPFEDNGDRAKLLFKLQ